MLKESGFENGAYDNCDRLGVWEGKLDAAAYGRGSRTSASGKGTRMGLHLYVRALEDDRKFWLFVFYFPTSEVYRKAQNLEVGNQIRLETVPGRDDHTIVKTLDKLS